MPIIKVAHHDHGYVVIQNKALEDSRLSCKARGLLAYLLTRPKDWSVNCKHLATIGPDGPTAIRSALKELRNAGYAKLEMGGSGAGGSVWVICECSEIKETCISDNSEIKETRVSGNRTLLSTNSKVLKAFKPLKRNGEDNAVFSLFEYFTPEERSCYGANWRLRYRESADKFRRVVADLHAEKQEGRPIASYAAIANIRWNEFAPRTKR